MYIAKKNLPIIGAVAIAIALPQLIGIILGNIFVGQIEDQWSRYKSHQRRRRYLDERDRGGRRY
jgi:carbon starvation protein CstA